jgi:hypothetical protein
VALAGRWLARSHFYQVQCGRLHNDLSVSYCFTEVFLRTVKNVSDIAYSHPVGVSNDGKESSYDGIKCCC